jgi:hypothetical protein
VAGYLILGAGKFGRLALARLSRQEAAAAFLVVDRDPKALAALRSLEISGLETRAAEAIAFLAANLREDCPWDWLLPMVPVHVAWAWLLAGPLRGWETIPAPAGLEALAPVGFRGAAGEVYLSRAAHLCPDDCPEPEVCPVTGESREEPLFAMLAKLELPDWSVRVVPSRQLAPGVGGYRPHDLLELAQELAESRGRFLIATACGCHGVAHGLISPERDGEL